MIAAVIRGQQEPGALVYYFEPTPQDVILRQKSDLERHPERNLGI